MKKIMFGQKKIQIAIKKIALDIVEDFKGVDEPPTLMFVTTGGIYTGVFLSFALEKFSFPHYVDTIGASRYDKDGKPGELRLKQPPKNSVDGKNIILVDDLVDEGKTIIFLKEYLLALGVKSVKTSTLFVKKEVTTFIPNFYGIEILGSPWVKGFGMDSEGLGRGTLFVVY